MPPQTPDRSPHLANGQTGSNYCGHILAAYLPGTLNSDSCQPAEEAAEAGAEPGQQAWGPYETERAPCWEGVLKNFIIHHLTKRSRQIWVQPHSTPNFRLEIENK